MKLLLTIHIIIQLFINVIDIAILQYYLLDETMTYRRRNVTLVESKHILFSLIIRIKCTSIDTEQWTVYSIQTVGSAVVLSAVRITAFSAHSTRKVHRTKPTSVERYCAVRRVHVKYRMNSSAPLRARTYIL